VRAAQHNKGCLPFLISLSSLNYPQQQALKQLLIMIPSDHFIKALKEAILRILINTQFALEGTQQRIKSENQAAAFHELNS